MDLTLQFQPKLVDFATTLLILGVRRTIFLQNSYFLSVKRSLARAKITNLYFEMPLTSHVGENNAPRTCVLSVVGAY